MSSPRTPFELQNDELFRSDLRVALENPAIQQAVVSLRHHRGLLRLAQTATPANVVHHAAVWVGGFNAALDSLFALTKVPVNPPKEREPWEHMQPEEDL